MVSCIGRELAERTHLADSSAPSRASGGTRSVRARPVFWSTRRRPLLLAHFHASCWGVCWGESRNRTEYLRDCNGISRIKGGTLCRGRTDRSAGPGSPSAARPRTLLVGVEGLLLL